jgi:outer membrane protein OmpA-like peptidoglycan-associated protein
MLASHGFYLASQKYLFKKGAVTQMTKNNNTLAILALSTIFTLSACQETEDKKAPIVMQAQQTTQSAAVECVDPAKVESATNSSTAASESSATTNAGSFDINSLPVINTNIGSFPYISVPEGFVIRGGKKNGVETGYTKFNDFSKLIMYTGESFFDAEGKRAVLEVDRRDNKEGFNQYKFDKSVDSYLEGIGAVRIFKGRIPNAKLKELNKENSSTVYDHITGDPWNNDPVRHYVLNHTKGKIMFQVWSNSAQGEIGVIELEGFKQTIQAPTASQIQKDIEATGKAILHINFDTNKASLKEDGDAVVAEIVKVLQANPALKISVKGYTDNEGNQEHNLLLSTYRSAAVVSAIVLSGVNSSRLTSEGLGASNPIGDNTTEAGRAMNRRVELVKQL